MAKAKQPPSAPAEFDPAEGAAFVAWLFRQPAWRAALARFRAEHAAEARTDPPSPTES